MKLKLLSVPWFSIFFLFKSSVYVRERTVCVFTFGHVNVGLAACQEASVGFLRFSMERVYRHWVAASSDPHCYGLALFVTTQLLKAFSIQVKSPLPPNTSTIIQLKFISPDIHHTLSLLTFFTCPALPLLIITTL